MNRNTNHATGGKNEESFMNNHMGSMVGKISTAWVEH